MYTVWRASTVYKETAKLQQILMSRKGFNWVEKSGEEDLGDTNNYQVNFWHVVTLRIESVK